MVVDLKEVQDLTNSVIDEIVDRSWLEIEGRDRGKDDGSHPVCLKHQFEMSAMKRGLPNHQDEFPPLF